MVYSLELRMSELIHSERTGPALEIFDEIVRYVMRPLPWKLGMATLSE